MKTRDDHDLHVALEMLYMALDKYDDPRRRFFEASAIVCVRHIQAPCWTCLVLMAMLAYQACLSSPLMDIVRAQDTR